MKKNEDLNYIKKFSKITIKKACKHFGYNQGNICAGKSGDIATRNVRKYIENELSKIYSEECLEYVKKDSSL